MKSILGYLKCYFIGIDKRILLLSSVFMALAIFINYYHGLNKWLSVLNNKQQFAGWYVVFLSAFIFPYLLLAAYKKNNHYKSPIFLILLLLAPALFAWKMAADVHFQLAANPLENNYWNHVIYWPYKLLVMVTALFIIWLFFDRRQTFYGFSKTNFKFSPYLWMLLIMLPLIAAASTRPDFLTTYPKYQQVLFLNQPQSNGWHRLLYELSYGCDFISIELFFRGFLILAFARFARADAILPMALFYCTIHFGKPLGECISSFFGGIILGVITFHTRTIWGGLIVHLGIAWLMELGGYLGRMFIGEW